MKLYFSPGACSLSPHIVLRESGLKFDLEQVDLRAKTIKSSGADFKQVNPKGQAPTLQLDNGDVLTEGAVIVQYVADQKPESGLAPKAGSMERYRLQEWLNFIASDLHKTFSNLFNPKAPDEFKGVVRELLTTNKFAYVDQKLAGKQYIMGDKFTVADAYLFTIGRWAKSMKLELDKLANYQATMARIAARPSVQEALKAEGITY